MEKVKVNIIGAGISGLTLGCYLQMNGFETTIFEKHDIPGGLCTSWDRKGYTMDGCAHWILGSGPGSSFYKLWSEILPMHKIPFHNHEIRIELELENKDKYGSNIFKFYTNIEKLRNYMLDISPEDQDLIDFMVKVIRVFQQFDLPPVQEDLPFFQSMVKGIKMSRYAYFYYWFRKMSAYTNLTYAARFKNPFLREAFEKFYDGEEVNMIVYIMPMAVYDKNSNGYPIGGSLNFAKRFEKRYYELGGKIQYKTPVNEILIEENSVKGVMVRHNVVHHADFTISTGDWYNAVFEMLKGRYVNKALLEMKDLKRNEVFYSVVQFSFGVNLDLKKYPHFIRYPINGEINSPDGTNYSRMEIHIYNYDPTLAPEGKTVLIVSFYTKSRDFWIHLRRTNRAEYRAAKAQMMSEVKKHLFEKMPEIADFIEVEDIATPATVNRYTNSWKGSTQGWLPLKDIMAGTPIKTTLPGLKNFYYTSHWCQPGGGLPVAIMKSREVAMSLCKKYGKRFTTQPADSL